MRTLWKIFVPLALVLPLSAFVAGSLVASASDDPPARDTIVIRESGATPGTPTATPSDDPTRGQEDDDTDDGDEVETVDVEPDDVHDDSDGRSDPYPGEDHSGDDSGSGGGEDDSSGHGGGDDGGDDLDDDSGHGGGDD